MSGERGPRTCFASLCTFLRSTTAPNSRNSSGYVHLLFPGPQHLGSLPAHTPPPVTPPAGLSLVQGGEVTRPSEVSRDLHILPPPLIPTPPPDEPRAQPHETWLPQPLPAERRGLEELEVPGMWGGEQARARVSRASMFGEWEPLPPQ